MNSTEFPEDTDSSDEDYVPGSGPNEAVSEVESDGDPEDPLSETEDLGKRGQKRRKKATKTKKKAKSELQDDTGSSTGTPEKKELTEEEKKKQADELWSSFKKDTGFKSKTIPPSESVEHGNKKSDSLKTPVVKTHEKVKITKIFEFAGEEVRVEKEVPVDSAEARLIIPSGSDPPKRGKGRSGLGGIGSVLSHLGKKQKISTLEKSKLDWDKFKKEEDLEEELQTFNRGKEGYLDRQDFLQRTDLRRFEIEKEIRTIERNKRLNNM